VREVVAKHLLLFLSSVFLFVSWLALPCLPAPMVKYAYATQSRLSPIMVMTCFPGYRFPSGMSSVIVQCDDNDGDGSWGHFDGCQREKTMFTLICLYIKSIIVLSYLNNCLHICRYKYSRVCCILQILLNYIL